MPAAQWPVRACRAAEMTAARRRLRGVGWGCLRRAVGFREELCGLIFGSMGILYSFIFVCQGGLWSFRLYFACQLRGCVVYCVDGCQLGGGREARRREAGRGRHLGPACIRSGSAGRDSWRGSEAGQFRRDRVPLGRSRSGRKWGPSSFGSMKDAPERGRLPAPRAPAGALGSWRVCERGAEFYGEVPWARGPARGWRGVGDGDLSACDGRGHKGGEDVLAGSSGGRVKSLERRHMSAPAMACGDDL